MKILVTPTSLQPGKQPAVLERLRQYSEDLVFNDYGRPLTEEELIPLLSGCDGFIAGLDQVTDRVISACPDLKVISRYGAGVDRVDLESAAAHNVVVTNTPGANAEAVGELTFALLLSVARRIPLLNASTREGGWVRSTGTELKGKTMGILGLGAIGKVTARCAFGFAMDVIAYDPYISLDYCTEHGIRSVEIDELFSSADVICMHLPLMDSTYHIIDEAAIGRMKPGTIIINASRGGLIDEDAAYRALKDGRLGGLGLDAFESEPPKDSPLFAFDNVVVTPHTGAHTKEATANMANMAVDNLIDVLEGRECRYIVRA